MDLTTDERIRRGGARRTKLFLEGRHKDLARELRGRGSPR